MIGKLPWLAAAFAIGLLLAAQPALNAEIARQAGAPLAAASLSLAISLALVLPFAALTWPGGGFGWLGTLPWWAFVGGVAGACFVLGGLTIVPAIGVVAFVGCVLFGQVVGATLIDQFGAFNMSLRPIGLERGLAIALVLAGVALFLRAAP